MNGLQVQFEAKDISNKFLEIQQLKGKTKSNSCIAIEHELMSDLSSVFSSLESADLKYSKGVPVLESDFIANAGPELNIFQNAYVDNIQGRVLLVRQSLRNLLVICEKKEVDAISKDNLDRNSKDMLYHLNNIIKYNPFTENLLKMGEMHQRRIECSNKADFYLDNAIYRYNCRFSPEFLTETHSLEMDINKYWTEQFQKPSNKGNFGLNKPRIKDLRSKKDYFANVIIPIFNNIQHHALNPENDIYTRQKSSKDICMSSEVDEDKKIITYTVHDNGMGIRPDIIDKIFDKGFSTKIDKTIEHGIGLWAVKNFVEENGGKIWVESEIGKFTKFNFTVPYDRKEHDWYGKD